MKSTPEIENIINSQEVEQPGGGTLALLLFIAAKLRGPRLLISSDFIPPLCGRRGGSRLAFKRGFRALRKKLLRQLVMLRG